MGVPAGMEPKFTAMPYQQAMPGYAVPGMPGDMYAKMNSPYGSGGGGYQTSVFRPSYDAAMYSNYMPASSAPSPPPPNTRVVGYSPAVSPGYPPASVAPPNETVTSTGAGVMSDSDDHHHVYKQSEYMGGKNYYLQQQQYSPLNNNSNGNHNHNNGNHTNGNQNHNNNNNNENNHNNQNNSNNHENNSNHINNNNHNNNNNNNHNNQSNSHHNHHNNHIQPQQHGRYMSPCRDLPQEFKSESGTSPSYTASDTIGRHWPSTQQDVADMERPVSYVPVL